MSQTKHLFEVRENPKTFYLFVTTRYVLFIQLIKVLCLI